jgi:glycosyltransferase involved in cell wall biosynthesis
MGIPVIAADVGGVKEALLHGQTGFLVAPNDITDARARFLYFFDDRSMIEKMGDEARNFIAKNFDIKKINKRLFSLYDPVHD